MKETTSFVFTGDVSFDKYMDHKWTDPELVDKKLRDICLSADHLAVNVEGPFCIPEENAAGEGVNALKHSMSPDAAVFLKKLGADIFNICNNHIMDAGEKGIADTLKIAHDMDVMTVGAGMSINEASSPLFFDEAGGIGLLSVGYERACRKATADAPGCLNFSDMDIVKEKIRQIKEKCRWCVVIAHDGEEFTALPSPYTRQRFRDYLDMGADIVVAHHPHVPMNYENVGEKVIFYSLGNFIFDTDYQRSQKNTEKGIFIKIDFTNESFDFEPYGILIDRKKQRICLSDLPDIFENVNDAEYQKLIPLSAKMFLENTKRQQKYLFPDKYINATEKDWYDNFYEPMRSGRVPKKLLDLQIIYPLAKEADNGEWKKSSLSKVRDFILEQIPDEGKA